MSILIEGIKMPKYCGNCKLFGEYGCAIIGAVGYALTERKRPDDCPLVELPEQQEKLLANYEDCRNELCLKCGAYQYDYKTHECEGCRWKKPA